MSTSRKLTGLPSPSTRGDCSHTAQPSSWRSVGDDERRRRAASPRRARRRPRGRRGRSAGRPARRRRGRGRSRAAPVRKGMRPPAACSSSTSGATGAAGNRCPSTSTSPAVGVDPDRAIPAARPPPPAGASSTGSPRLTQLRRKMRAKLGPTTACTPQAFIACGTCSREEPIPKFGPVTRIASSPSRSRSDRVEALEEVRLHQLGVVDVQVRAGVHDVGVDVVAGDHDRPAFDDHAGAPASTSAGCDELAGDRRGGGDVGVREVAPRPRTTPSGP